MIERSLQVIQELREAYKEAHSECHAANEAGDVHGAYFAARRMEMAYNAFQRAVEEYEKNRLRGTTRLPAGGSGDGFKGW